MKFEIKSEVFEKFPNMFIAIPIIKGFKNKGNDEIVEKLMRDAEKILKNSYKDIKEYEADDKVRSYFECFKAFGVNPKKVRPTHYSLGKRVIGGGELPDVNPMVNVYNAFSIKYVTPFGGENLDNVYGDFQLKFAKGDEHWLGIGFDKPKAPKVGDLIWGDDYDVSTLSLNHLQCERTKMDEATTNGYFIMDGFVGVNDEHIKTVAQEFSEFIVENFGGEFEILYLDSKTPSVEIDFESKSIDGVKLPAIEKGNQGDEVAVNGRKGIKKRKLESLGLVGKQGLAVKLQTLIGETLGQSDGVDALLISESNKPEVSDYTSTSALQRAKHEGANPREYAEKIIGTLSESKELMSVFSDISIAGPGFINFTLSDEFLIQNLDEAVKSLENGTSLEFTKAEVGEGRKILVESPSWNPNKAAHAGHLLNMLLGQTLKRLVSRSGFVALGDDIDNDKGIPVMQMVWAYMKYGEDKTPESEGELSDVFVNNYYDIGKKEFDADEKVQEEIREVLRKWEAKDEDVRAVWKKLTTWGREGQDEVFRLYGEIRDAHQWHESDVYEGGKEIVQAAVGKGVIEKLDDGALIARIEKEYGLPDTIVLKRDGSGLYHTQDINLTIQKKDKFNDPWMLVWVVAEEQIVHFQRLFSILDAMGIMPIDNLYHFAYGWVVGKDGKKLSSRSGVDLSASGLFNMAFEKAKALVMERGSDKSSEEIDEIANAVAIGSIKYFLLSHDPFKTIKFDLDTAVSFTGHSGPYVMYSYTRAKNILSKLGVVEGDVNYIGLELSAEDRGLLIKVLKYPKVLVSATNNFSPSLIAEYLYDLARTFSGYYEKVNVKESEGAELKMRTDLLNLYAEVIKSGLEILGIDVLESM
jgi:arginyl-tRNA synthetase